MKIKKLTLDIRALNPIAAARRKKMRAQIRNKEASLLTPNCLGGLLFHDLGLEFRSPTIDLTMYQYHFIRYVLDRENYQKKKLEFYRHPDYTSPCAHLGDIDINFTHYKTPEEAEKKWVERSKRIDADNLFIFAMERDGIGKKEILDLGRARARGILVFTAHPYKDIPYALYLPAFRKEGQVGNIMGQSLIDDSRGYEKYFDFIKWLNEADGGDHDISPYVRRANSRGI